MTKKKKQLLQTDAAMAARGTHGLTVTEMRTEQAAQIAQGMTIAQQIEAFLAARMAERAAAKLKIVTRCADETLLTCYPKDEATKQR